MSRLYRKFVKRTLDFIFALILTVVLSPVLGVLAILASAKSGGPALFRQERPGKDGRIFTLYKFRSMTDGTDPDGNHLPDEERLTSFGRKLRSTSLDELPELWNILRGDMSFVGPRPLLVQYLPRYSSEQARRHEVRPGLTGYAQINGRNAITWQEKFAYDVWYVDNLSLALDVRILFRTGLSVFKREGISSEGSATMEEFMGNGPLSREDERGIPRRAGKEVRNEE